MGRPPNEQAQLKAAYSVGETLTSLSEAFDTMANAWRIITKSDDRMTGLSGNGDVIMWLVQLNALRLQALFWLRDASEYIGSPAQIEVARHNKHLVADSSWLDGELRLV